MGGGAGLSVVPLITSRALEAREPGRQPSLPSGTWLGGSLTLWESHSPIWKTGSEISNSQECEGLSEHAWKVLCKLTCDTQVHPCRSSCVTHASRLPTLWRVAASALMHPGRLCRDGDLGCGPFGLLLEHFLCVRLCTAPGSIRPGPCL